MMIGLLATALAAATPGVAPGEAPLCGLEELHREELQVCPPAVAYDEEGEEVGGETRGRAELDHD